MDPVTASVLGGTITALLNGTAGEAGKAAWASLATATRRLLGHDPGAVQALTAVETASEAGESTLAGTALATAERLVAAAEADPEYAELLATWQVQARTLVHVEGATTNVVSGNAQVGKLVQARDVGTLNFG